MKNDVEYLDRDALRRSLLEIAQAGYSADGLAQVFSKTHSLVQRLIGGDNCSIYLKDPISGQIRLEYWGDVHYPPPVVDDALRGFAGWVLRTGKSVAVEENSSKRLAKQFGLAELPDVEWSAWMGAPLIASSRAVGAISIHSYISGLTFSDRDLEVLSTIAAQVSAVIEKKRSEQALRESESRYRMLFDHAPDGIIICDLAGTTLDANSNLCRMLGYTREEFLALKREQLLAGSELERVDAALSEIAMSSEHHREWAFRHKNGTIVPVEVSASRMPDNRILAIVRDLSERRKAESERARLAAEVEEQRERLNNIIATVPGVVWETWFETGMKVGSANFVSHYITEMLGYTVEEWLSQPDFWLSIVHPDHRSRIEETADRLGGGKRTRVLPLIAKDGSTVWVESHSAEIRDAKGEPLATRGVMIDVTERKRSETALRHSEERYRDLVENAMDIIYVHDLKGNYTSINKAAERITGYSKTEILSMNMQQTLAPEFVDLAREMMAAKLAGDEVTVYEVEIVAKDGRRVVLEIKSRLITADGRPVAVQGIARDVTERKLLEEKYRQSQKMEAIGLLAGGVSHDFNNLLTAISGYSELTLAKMQPSDPLRRNIEEIRNIGERAASLTKQLLAFSRKQILQPVVHDLNSTVLTLDNMLRRLLRENINFELDLEDGLPNIEADPIQLQQVVVNLTINAQDAMPAGGQLTISTRSVEAADMPDNGSHERTAARFIKLSVADTGEGMDEQTVSRIFEPFFTTKEQGRGSGLGLSTVHGIVAQSGGHIHVSTSKGSGTTFDVYLPAAAMSGKIQAVAAAGPGPSVGNETVLLVEDDDSVRNLVREILIDKGYKVLVASSGEEAVAICSNRPAPIHLLLTDLVMPKMSGLELSREAVRLQPGLKTVIMTGYVTETLDGAALRESSPAFVQKPFTPDGIARKIREVLDETAGVPKSPI